MSDPLWLVGGLGDPHDRLAAAALSGEGRPARAVGALDEDAYDRGRAALPRGQCAPILYTTGALLREAERHSRSGASGSLGWVSPRSCGPCRYALFETAWTRALAQAGHAHASIVGLGQSVEALVRLLSPAGAWRVLDALVVADVLREVGNRLRPHVADPMDLERRVREATRRVAEATASGGAPVDALRREAPSFVGLPLRPAAPLARAQLIGDPWSLHVDGDGQLNVVRVLASAGVEVEQPPFAFWIDYLAWQRRSAPFGAAAAPSASDVAMARDIEARLRDRLAAASDAVGLGGLALPSQDELAQLAAPHLSPSLRGGYGHLEVALALRAREERRAHVVFSVKSFGCIPSSGISDAIVPTVIGPSVSFLALEVSGDGEAARESRLMLRVASALDAAERELAEACRRSGRDPGSIDPPPPLSGRFAIGARPYASTLACAALGEAS